jgi:hypothetical protein
MAEMKRPAERRASKLSEPVRQPRCWLAAAGGTGFTVGRLIEPPGATSMITDRVKSLACAFACAIAVAAALSMTAPSAHAANVQVANCATTKVTHAYTDEQVATSTTSFQNIPNTGFVFTQGGAASSCAVIDFFATARTGADTMEVRVTLDGHTLGLPPQVIFVRNSDQVSAAASFFFPGVAPGMHRVRILYRSTTGDSVDLVSPRTIAHHR